MNRIVASLYIVRAIVRQLRLTLAVLCGVKK